jgi:hypothetical protein
MLIQSPMMLAKDTFGILVHSKQYTFPGDVFLDQLSDR